MNKKQIFLLSFIIVLATAGVTWGVVNKWEHRAKVPAGTTVQQALNQAHDAQKALVLHDAVNKNNLDTANAKIAQQSTNITTLCTQLKSARLTNAICQ